MNTEIKSAEEILIKEMVKYPHEATKGYRYLAQWIINAMEDYAAQFDSTAGLEDKIKEASKNWAKVEDKDQWLNEVRGNESDISAEDKVIEIENFLNDIEEDITLTPFDVRRKISKFLAEKYIVNEKEYAAQFKKQL